MQTYITNIKLSGIKNIDKEISLDFYKKTRPKKFILDRSNIKAIYGENGVGKTGIIHAMEIYKKINLDRNYLSDSRTYGLLEELVNKVTHCLSIKITFFAIFDGDTFIKLAHEICIKKEGTHYSIIKEVIYELNKKVETEVISIANGEFQNSSLMINEELRKKTMNLLKDRSFLNVFIHDCFKDTMTSMSDFGNVLTNVTILTIVMNSDIMVILNDTDNHDLFRGINQTFILDYGNRNKLSINKASNDEQRIYQSKQFNCINTNADVIKLEDVDDYKEKIEKMSKFIQLFKVNLHNIEIDMKEDEGHFICEKYFVYDGYRINIEFESTGIKKLVQLFSAFEYFVEGGIVFIDEFDANIHDVYLSALLEYFTYYAKGQLCFTTHNLGPMEVLRKQRFSIDFLSRDHLITSWKKRGNYSVVNLYREGMIENSPFNIEPFDFAEIFATGE